MDSKLWNEPRRICLIDDSKRIGGKKYSCATVSLLIVPLFLASCFCLHQAALWQMRTCPHMNSTLHEKDGVPRCMREHQTYRIIQSFDSNSKQHKPCKRSWSPPLVRQSRFDFDLKATIRVPSSKVKQKKCGMVMCHYFAKTTSWPSFTIQLFVEPCGISRVLTTAQTNTAPSYDLPEFCSLLATCFDFSCRLHMLMVWVDQVRDAFIFLRLRWLACEEHLCKVLATFTLLDAVLLKQPMQCNDWNYIKAEFARRETNEALSDSVASILALQHLEIIFSKAHKHNLIICWEAFNASHARDALNLFISSSSQCWHFASSSAFRSSSSNARRCWAARLFRERCCTKFMVRAGRVGNDELQTSEPGFEKQKSIRPSETIRLLVEQKATAFSNQLPIILWILGWTLLILEAVSLDWPRIHPIVRVLCLKSLRVKWSQSQKQGVKCNLITHKMPRIFQEWGQPDRLSRLGLPHVGEEEEPWESNALREQVILQNFRTCHANIGLPSVSKCISHGVWLLLLQSRMNWKLNHSKYLDIICGLWLYED